ncbi:hypothetical protein EHZ47_01785 [Aeromonas jandaei]|uniref:hypothetical protein n=1 Tax=Aeromonas jandaei TaxID=650 RepID=UPI000F51C689|nr:hypothetical protein [Aeromonas jandaei]RQM78848.1 hypothetical protein EHZ47_01785 [Aeromonas jandaei]
MVFAKPGDSAQQFGGELPDGWVEMSKQRPDGDGWIADKTGNWVKHKPNADDVRSLREAAYRIESDPLFMEARYDDDPIKLKAWKDKVTEIKARYPLPQ